MTPVSAARTRLPHTPVPVRRGSRVRSGIITNQSAPRPIRSAVNRLRKSLLRVRTERAGGTPTRYLGQIQCLRGGQGVRRDRGGRGRGGDGPLRVLEAVAGDRADDR